MICIYICIVYSSLTWIKSDRSLPIISSGSAVAYSSSTNLIWLIGGWHNQYGKVAFEPEQITVNTTSPYIYNGEFNGCTTNLCTTYFWGQGYTQIDDILYMTDTYTQDFSLFNLSASSQQFIHQYDEISDFPVSIGGGANACLASIGNYLLLSGGVNTQGGYRDNLQIYDISTSKWIYGAAKMSVGRGFHACIVANNYFYVIGGRVQPQIQLDNVSKIYVGDIDNIQEYIWQDLNDTLRTPTERIRAVVYGNDIYTMGGATYIDSYPFDTLPYVDLIRTSDDRIIPQTDLLQVADSVTPMIIHDTLFVLGGWSGTNYIDTIQYAILFSFLCIHILYSERNVVLCI